MRTALRTAITGAVTAATALVCGTAQGDPVGATARPGDRRAWEAAARR